MKFENNHHVKTEDLTFEQYYRFRKKTADQGINPVDFTINYWKTFNYIGIKDGYLFIGDSYFTEHPEMLLTIDQALAEDELIDAVNEMRQVNNEIENLFKRKAELEKIICDGLDIS